MTTMEEIVPQDSLFHKVDKYIDKAATITYNFKIKEPSNVLYFYSSEIK